MPKKEPRKALKVNTLLDGYLKRSRELSDRLDDMAQEVEALKAQVDKKHKLEARIVEVSELIDDAECSVEAIKKSYLEATFNRDQDAIDAVQARRAELVAGIENYKLERAELQEELAQTTIDSATIGELQAQLQRGITLPQHNEFIEAMTKELASLAQGQQAKITALRSSLPTKYADVDTYEEIMLGLDSSFRTRKQQEESRQRRQAQRQEEIRRFNQGPKPPSERARANRANEARAAQAPVEAATQW